MWQTSIIKLLIISMTLLNNPVMGESVSSNNLLLKDRMRLITDNVMGGVSSGAVDWISHDGTDCLSLTGNVSTANNGGFIQAAMDIEPDISKALSMQDAVVIKARGNGESYNVHLRTSDLWFPWQAYRASFETDGNWQIFRIALQEFVPYKTSTQLNPKKIKRIGIVALGRDFNAEICIAELAFDRSVSQ